MYFYFMHVQFAIYHHKQLRVLLLIVRVLVYLVPGISQQQYGAAQLQLNSRSNAVVTAVCMYSSSCCCIAVGIVAVVVVVVCCYSCVLLLTL